MTSQTLPKAFIWRRLHSLMGLWLVLFLCEHLLVNSQAALLLGDNARGFIELVNSIHNFPYLQVIEIFLLGVPIAIHAVWGIKYLLTAKFNSHKTDGTAPDMRQYGRNRAYTWQRLTSWILLVGIVLHVAKFRFIDYPASINLGDKQSYFVTVSVDKGLYTVASRLGVQLYGPEQMQEQKEEIESRHAEQTLVEVAGTLKVKDEYDAQQQIILSSAQAYEQKVAWLQVLEKQRVSPTEVVAVASDFGTATLLSVRDTFKSPLYVGLYTVFVLAACFHAFNGFWTFLITWGVVLKLSSQRGALRLAWGFMALVAFLGLAAVWGTYFLNLKV
jgi:succinate dehydrogenase / fumarate reductase cytochrome b subunit